MRSGKQKPVQVFWDEAALIGCGKDKYDELELADDEILKRYARADMFRDMKCIHFQEYYLYPNKLSQAIAREANALWPILDDSHGILGG